MSEKFVSNKAIQKARRDASEQFDKMEREQRELASACIDEHCEKAEHKGWPAHPLSVLVDRELLVYVRDDLGCLLGEWDWKKMEPRNAYRMEYDEIKSRHNTLSDILGLERLE